MMPQPKYKLLDVVYYINRNEIREVVIFDVQARLQIVSNEYEPVFSVQYLFGEPIDKNNRSFQNTDNSHGKTLYLSKRKCAEEWLRQQGLNCGLSEKG